MGVVTLKRVFMYTTIINSCFIFCIVDCIDMGQATKQNSVYLYEMTLTHAKLCQHAI